LIGICRGDVSRGKFDGGMSSLGPAFRQCGREGEFQEGDTFFRKREEMKKEGGDNEAGEKVHPTEARTGLEEETTVIHPKPRLGGRRKKPML